MLVVLLDDAGFGSSSAFGGPCQTPTFERLASNGLRYNRFHTTALCSPTRQALLTGRNHHSVGMGGITEIATSAPGYSSVRPKTAAPLAETLKLNGYSTAQFGKCHEVPVWQTSPMGPFDNWPSGGGGFEHFYGFIGGETNQYAPAIYNGTIPVEPDRTPEEGYHFTEDMTDKAIDWVRQQKALMPDKPFFVVLRARRDARPAPRADRVVGQVQGPVRRTAGTRCARRRSRARRSSGWSRPMPSSRRAPTRSRRGTTCPTSSSRSSPARWRSTPGFMEHTDHHVGRLIDALADLGILDDTLVYVIIGDNGASAEGTPNGTFNELVVLNGAAGIETAEFMASRIDEFGTPEAYNHYAVGWAHAMDTPYQWTKQIASHWGGTRNGTIVHWPNGIKAKGEVRSQFHHVIDVAADGARRGRAPGARRSCTACSRCRCRACRMAYSFDDAAAAERHETQYFEMFCNRGIYHKGWTAVTRHSTPWVMTPSPPLDDDVWELYDPDDWTQAHDLAAEQPEKLAELQRLFLIEATKYNVLPLDDRRVERFNPDLAGRPQLVRGNSPAAVRRHGAAHRELRRRAQEQVARRDGADRRARRRRRGRHRRPGRRLRRLEPLPQGRPARLLLQPLRPAAVQGLRRDRRLRRRAPGADGVRLRRRRAWARAATATLYVDGAKVGDGRVDATVPMLFSADETTDVGTDGGTPVSDDLRPAREPLHRPRTLGGDRPRRGRAGRRPPHHARGAPDHRDGAPIAEDKHEMPSVATPKLSDEAVVEMLSLMKGAGSVELKLTIPESAQRSTFMALGMDPLGAQVRVVSFYDTPDLQLESAGVVVRSRRVAGKGDDSVVKLRPVVPSELPRKVRESPWCMIEVDAMPGGFVCSASMKGVPSTPVLDVAAGTAPLRKLYSKEQRAFFAEHAPAGIGFEDLVLLGPIFVLKLKASPQGFARKMVVELWLYPDGTRILELSTKCAPDEAFQVAAEGRAFLTERGIEVGGAQTTKTRKALEFFSNQLKETG